MSPITSKVSDSTNPDLPLTADDLDLSLPADVLAYLAHTPFASTHVEPLSGGNANFVFRLHLARPYAGHATLVLKHAKSWVKWDQNFKLDVKRQVRPPYIH